MILDDGTNGSFCFCHDATTAKERGPSTAEKQNFVPGAWVISLLELVKDLAEGWLLVESFDNDK